MSGAAVVENFPFGPLAGTAFNLTTMSYHGTLFMGLFIETAQDKFRIGENELAQKG